MTTTPALDLPLNDPGFYTSDRFDVYHRLRDEFPVYWCEQGGFWALTRHEDVLAVQKDPSTFCNGQGMTMRGGELADVKGGETLITTDAPEHTYQRKLVNRPFRQRAVGKLEPHVRDIARGILDEVPVGEPIDFVRIVASRLPVIVIAELLGVPVDDRERFVAWSNASIGMADPEYAELHEQAMLEQFNYFEHILGERQSCPRDDLLTVLVDAERDHEDFGHQDVLSMCFLLLAAGNETTRNVISHSVVALSRHPEQRAMLADGCDSKCAVEELLRWTSPVIHMARTVTRETVVRDQPLQAGDQVVVLYGAANHDERVFGDTAEELDLTRHPNPHLAFGFGEHFCLGAALARMEARVLLEEMVDRFSDWDVVGPVERLRSTMIAGIKHFPVILKT
jgi:cytochrome P450